MLMVIKQIPKGLGRRFARPMLIVRQETLTSWFALE